MRQERDHGYGYARNAEHRLLERADLPTKIVMTISLIILTLQGLAEIVSLIQRLRAMKGEKDK